MMLFFWNYLTEWLDRTTCLTSGERKRVKTAATHLLHTSDSMVQRMAPDYAEKLVNDASHTTLNFIDNTSEKIKHSDCGKLVDVNDVFDLAEYALEGCCRCRVKNHTECKRYQLFLKMDIPPAVEQTDGCPYKN